MLNSMALFNESRFDLAYKAIMQSAKAALQAKGYRVLTSKPGHHQLTLQVLPLTIGLEKIISSCLITYECKEMRSTIQAILFLMV
jgi:hypothetical protein